VDQNCSLTYGKLISNLSSNSTIDIPKINFDIISQDKLLPIVHIPYFTVNITIYCYRILFYNTNNTENLQNIYNLILKCMNELDVDMQFVYINDVDFR